MTIDVVDTTVVSVWTPADEARLRELQERRDRIMSENRGRLISVMASEGISADKSEELVDRLIACAGPMRAALKPFDEVSP